MDTDVMFRIIAIGSAAGVYVLCLKNILHYLLSKNGNALLLKSSLLTAGLFMALIMGFVILIDLMGGALASGYTFIMLALTLIADVVCRRRWQAQERSREQLLEDVKRATNARQSGSLEEACSKAARRNNLTRQEERVLGLLLQGLSYAQIGERLCLSHSTIKSHVRNLYRKMEVNRRELLVQKMHEEQEGEDAASGRTRTEAPASLRT